MTAHAFPVTSRYYGTEMAELKTAGGKTCLLYTSDAADE